MDATSIVRYELPPGTVALHLTPENFLELLKPHFTKMVTGVSVEEDDKGHRTIELTFTE